MENIIYNAFKKPFDNLKTEYFMNLKNIKKEISKFNLIVLTHEDSVNLKKIIIQKIGIKNRVEGLVQTKSLVGGERLEVAAVPKAVI